MIRKLAATALLVVSVGALVGGIAAPASAHVLPTSTVILDVHEDEIDASLTIPIDDLTAASGLELGSGSAADIDANAAAIETYISDHFHPESATGGAWAVTVDDLGVTTSEELGTGVYSAVTATAHLVSPAGADIRSFDLGYDVIVERVITHVVLVSVRTDWTTGTVDSAREIGTIRLDTATGEITPLRVDLGDGSSWQGFTSMVTLGISHIAEGTDHQLFLLTLLLPASLLVASRRWAGPVRPKRAVRRIAGITLAFTLGHSVTLALGTLGLPVPQQAVEALIAISILIAAAHAIRPIFAGREALIAGVFGLVHGMAFSATLSQLDLTGGQLVLSLLGFNLGIEIMQLAVVALVLPPLILLARTPVYPRLRLLAATLTGIAAVGWLLARLGIANPIATAADSIGIASPWLVAALWITAIGLAISRRRRFPASSGDVPARVASASLDRSSAYSR